MKFILSNFILLLKRFKTSSIFNILGLSAAFTLFIVIVIQVNYDFSYNKSFKNSKNIYLYNKYMEKDSKYTTSISRPEVLKIADNFPEIKNYCLLQSPYNVGVKIERNGEEQNFTQSFIGVSPGFAHLFATNVLQGNVEESLRDKTKAVISKSNAIQLFGDENAIGKVIKLEKQEFTVGAVYQDFPKNSSIINACYINLQMYDESSVQESGFQLYIELENNAKELEEKLNSANFRGADMVKYFEAHPESRYKSELFSLNKVHLNLNKNLGGVLSLLTMGILILIIAFINLLNMSVAMAPSRVKALNIHKILGINNNLLKSALILESVFISIIAIIVAIICVHFFSSSAMVYFFKASLKLSDNKVLITIVSLLLLGITFLVSLYPTIYATSFKIDLALKGSFSLSKTSGNLRNTLIVIQFIAAIVLITFSGFVKVQHKYMQNYNWGIQKENIVFVPVKGLQTDYKTFGEDLKKHTEILDYTASMFIPGSMGMGRGMGFEGKNVTFVVWPVVPNFFDFFGIKIIFGNNFSEGTKGTEDRDQYIFNKKFLDQNEFNSSVVGKDISFSSKPGTVIGIVDDINFENLRKPIRPLAFIIGNNPNYIFIKLSGNNLNENVKYIENTWAKFSGNTTTTVKFLDEHLDNMYRSENNLAKLIALCGIVAMLIAIMGIYGLISFNIIYKEKEIAIRKVNGSTEKEIVLMLNKSLLIQFITAFVISIPIIYYIIIKWLAQFNYKAVIPWWLFISTGLLVFVVALITVSWKSWKAAIRNPINTI